MSNKNNGGPAFPQVTRLEHHGMTLRDYFAAKAMNGYLICPVEIFEPDGSNAPDILKDSDIARLSYAMADAMLAERIK